MGHLNYTLSEQSQHVESILYYPMPTIFIYNRYNRYISVFKTFFFFNVSNAVDGSGFMSA